jgi:hypothetical protein
VGGGHGVAVGDAVSVTVGEGSGVALGGAVTVAVAGLRSVWVSVGRRVTAAPVTAPPLTAGGVVPSVLPVPAGWERGVALETTGAQAARAKASAARLKFRVRDIPGMIA